MESHGSTDDFWRSIAAAGTPLIERIPGDERFVAVTFLYRGTAETRSVAVIALENHQMANDRFFELAKLARLGTTDIWYRTYRLRADGRFTYRLSVNDEGLFANLSPAQWANRVSGLTRDPLNLHDTTTRDGPVSLVELPEAPPLRWLTAVPGVAKGRIDSANVGDRAKGLGHSIAVYASPGYSPGTRAQNLLIVLDGEGIPGFVPMPTILDNLSATKHLGTTVAVMVANRPGKRIQDLAYSPELLAYMRDDLIPWIRRTTPSLAIHGAWSSPVAARAGILRGFSRSSSRR